MERTCNLFSPLLPDVYRPSQILPPKLRLQLLWLTSWFNSTAENFVSLYQNTLDDLAESLGETHPLVSNWCHCCNVAHDDIRNYQQWGHEMLYHIARHVSLYVKVRSGNRGCGLHRRPGLDHRYILLKQVGMERKVNPDGYEQRPWTPMGTWPGLNWSWVLPQAMTPREELTTNSYELGLVDWLTSLYHSAARSQGLLEFDVELLSLDQVHDYPEEEMKVVL